MTNFENLFQQLIQSEIEKALKPLQKENQDLRQEIWQLRQDFESIFQGKVAAPVEETQEEIQEEASVEETIETEEETAPTEEEEDTTPYPSYLLDKPDSQYDWERNQWPARLSFKKYYPHFEAVDLIKKIAEKSKRNPQVKARLRATINQWGGELLLREYARFKELSLVNLGKLIGYKETWGMGDIYEPKDKAILSDSALPLTLEELKELAS